MNVGAWCSILCFSCCGVGFFEQHKVTSEVPKCSPSAELETTVREKGGTQTPRAARIPLLGNSPKDPRAPRAASRAVPMWGDKKITAFCRAGLKNKGSLSLLCLGCFEAVLVLRGELTLPSVQMFAPSVPFFFVPLLVVNQTHAPNSGHCIGVVLGQGKRKLQGAFLLPGTSPPADNLLSSSPKQVMVQGVWGEPFPWGLTRWICTCRRR